MQSLLGSEEGNVERERELESVLKSIAPSLHCASAEQNCYLVVWIQVYWAVVSGVMVKMLIQTT